MLRVLSREGEQPLERSSDRSGHPLYLGELLADGETGPASYAGIFATKRNEATNDLFITFGDFSVAQGDDGGGDAFQWPDVFLADQRRQRLVESGKPGALQTQGP